MNTTTRTTHRRQVALLDPNAKAKVTRPPVQFRHDPIVMRAKATNPTVTREPDLVDDAEAMWFGDTFAVVVPLEHLDTFRAWVNCRGLSTSGRGTYRIEHLVWSEVDWARLYATVRP